VKASKQAFGATLPANLRVMFQHEVAGLVDAGSPAEIAEEVVGLLPLLLVPEVMQIAAHTEAPLARVVEGYFAVSDAFRIDRILAAGSRIVSGDHYESLALARSIDQIGAARRNIVVSAFAQHGGEKQPVHAWLAAQRHRTERLGLELAALSETGETSLAKIAVAAGLLSDLANNGTK